MTKHLFLSANTPDGFVQYFDKIIDMYNLKKLYILKGGSGVGKSTFMTRFANELKDTADSVTYIHCSSDPKSLDGVVLEDIGVGIIDGTAPHMIDVKYPGMIDETINLGEFIIEEKVKATKEKIDEIAAEKSKQYATAYQCLKRAREAHIKLEELYKDAVDFASVNALCNKLITSTKALAGAINRNSRRENSTK